VGGGEGRGPSIGPGNTQCIPGTPERTNAGRKASGKAS
jgi:hypothetical protein